MPVEIHIFDRLEDEFETYPKGHILIEQGATKHPMYAVIKGEVSVEVEGKFLHAVGKGGIVGEMALIDPAPASATVMVTTDEATVVPVDEGRFQFLVQQTPFFAVQVMRLLVERLREATALGAHYLK